MASQELSALERAMNAVNVIKPHGQERRSFLTTDDLGKLSSVNPNLKKKTEGLLKPKTGKLASGEDTPHLRQKPRSTPKFKDEIRKKDLEWLTTLPTLRRNMPFHPDFDGEYEAEPIPDANALSTFTYPSGSNWRETLRPIKVTLAGASASLTRPGYYDSYEHWSGAPTRVQKEADEDIPYHGLQDPYKEERIRKDKENRKLKSGGRRRIKRKYKTRRRKPKKTKKKTKKKRRKLSKYVRNQKGCKRKSKKK